MVQRVSMPKSKENPEAATASGFNIAIISWRTEAHVLRL